MGLKKEGVEFASQNFTVARAEQDRAGKILRDGEEGASAAHADVPGLEREGQLRAEREEEVEEAAEGRWRLFDAHDGVLLVGPVFPGRDGDVGQAGRVVSVDGRAHVAVFEHDVPAGAPGRRIQGWVGRGITDACPLCHAAAVASHAHTVPPDDATDV